MDVRLPKLGEGADSGSVVGILVKEGDQIKAGQSIIELENEKAVAPIPSPADGKVAKIFVKEGDKISVGQLILALGEAVGGAPAPRTGEPEAKPAQRPEREAAPAPTPPPAEEEPLPDAEELPSGMAPAAPPSVRKVARELGIDLRRIRGSEAGGRIVMGDLRAYIQRLERLAAQAKARPAAAVAPGKPVEHIDFSQWGPVAIRPMSQLRKTIARRMLESWSAIPHVTQFEEADITWVNELRKKHAPAYEAKGAKLTVTAFVIKAVVVTLKQHPIFNSSLDESSESVVFKDYYHLGLAVDTEAGLIVPVMRHVDRKSLFEISQEIATLAAKARDRKVSLEDLRGGTFTISNQGGIGGAHFTPIINKPEVAILGLGRGDLKPVVREGRVEPRLLLPLGVSYDHRVIDGANAARFTADLVRALEEFPENEVKL